MLNEIVFKDTLPESKDYWELFKTTGWNNEYNFSIDELESAIKNSWYLCSLYNLDKLIGFGRVISDGIHHALIVDLIIHPEYQGKGLGSKILEKLIIKCTSNKIRDIQLFAAKDKFKFYEKYGFEKRLIKAPGMQFMYNNL